jgi:hypothetical protein
MVMQNNEKKMTDGDDEHEANFVALTFDKGTRLHVVQLLFKQQVSVAGGC